MTDSSGVVLSTERLTFAYGEAPVLRGLDLSLRRGSFSGLIGPNGCGKSTLMRLLAGVLVPASGRILLDGEPLASIAPRTRALRIAYVPQQQRSVFPFTALEVVLTGRSPHGSRFRFESDADRRVALEALDEVDAGHLASRPVTELSGGEQQMVTVARALAQRAEVLLLDEPSASLDLKHRSKLLGTLKRLRSERGMTALVVTHDLQMLDETFDHLFALRRGELAAEGPPRAVLSEATLAAIYEDPHVRTREVEGRTFVWSEA